MARLRLTQDPAAAEALFARVVDSIRNDSVALSDLGVARDMQGHHAAAQEAYRTGAGRGTRVGRRASQSGPVHGACPATPARRALLHPLAARPVPTPRIRHDLALALALSGQQG